MMKEETYVVLAGDLGGRVLDVVRSAGGGVHVPATETVEHDLVVDLELESGSELGVALLQHLIQLHDGGHVQERICGSIESLAHSIHLQYACRKTKMYIAA